MATISQMLFIITVKIERFIEYNDGGRVWYYHGKRINCTSQEEFEAIIKELNV